MLWTLLALVGSVSLVGGSLIPLMVAGTRAGAASYAVAVGIGLLLGCLNFWVMSRVAGVAERRWENCTQQQREKRARLLYLAVVVWIPTACMLAARLVSALV
jgi:hypothetical protein